MHPRELRRGVLPIVSQSVGRMLRILRPIHGITIIGASVLYAGCWLNRSIAIAPFTRPTIWTLATVAFFSGLVILSSVRGVTALGVLIGASTILGFVLAFLTW